jgi:hypothetical protein
MSRQDHFLKTTDRCRDHSSHIIFPEPKKSLVSQEEAKEKELTGLKLEALSSEQYKLRKAITAKEISKAIEKYTAFMDKKDYDSQMRAYDRQCRNNLNASLKARSNQHFLLTTGEYYKIAKKGERLEIMFSHYSISNARLPKHFVLVNNKIPSVQGSDSKLVEKIFQNYIRN